jgi:hypothetical protein
MVENPDKNHPSNIPNPDPSVVANERLAEAVKQLRSEIISLRMEVKGWVDALQVLHEEKIRSSIERTESLDRVVQTRLAGSETALNAAMAASDKVVAKIETGVGAIMNEMKASFSKQLDSLKDNIDELKKRIFESGGRSEGAGNLITWIIAGLAAFAAIAMFIVAMSRDTAQPPRQPTSVRSSTS